MACGMGRLEGGGQGIGVDSYKILVIYGGQ